MCLHCGKQPKRNRCYRKYPYLSRKRPSCSQKQSVSRSRATILTRRTKRTIVDSGDSTVTLFKRSSRENWPHETFWSRICGWSSVFHYLHGWLYKIDICGLFSDEIEALQFLKRYKAHAETHTNRSKYKIFEKRFQKSNVPIIEVPRFDSGGEHLTNVFKDYLIAHAISIQLTVAYTHQQNWVAECKNRTLFNLAR